MRLVLLLRPVRRLRRWSHDELETAASEDFAFVQNFKGVLSGGLNANSAQVEQQIHDRQRIGGVDVALAAEDRQIVGVAHQAQLDLRLAGDLGQGGKDRNNLVYLCPDHFDADGLPVKGCHSKQEGRTAAFVAELSEAGTPVNLYAKARDYTERFDQKRKEEF